jgi:hypothetical protein
MKLQHLFDSMRADIVAVMNHFGLTSKQLKENLGKDGTALMWLLLKEVSIQRSYDDSHPLFMDGRARFLPFDGRDYCFYYANGANDDHVETLLKKIRDSL